VICKKYFPEPLATLPVTYSLFRFDFYRYQTIICRFFTMEW